MDAKFFTELCKNIPVVVCMTNSLFLGKCYGHQPCANTPFVVYQSSYFLAFEG